ncbi:conserved protein of unknown function [Lactiplantibacillus plantarum]|jgi:hypothetical protein|nr:hypothetical protein [Lactiplantibacillus plantarum]ASL81120.1 hypothetical protein GBLP1_g2636 [Lactiplantibacillus plantarum]
MVEIGLAMIMVNTVFTREPQLLEGNKKPPYRGNTEEKGSKSVKCN